LVVWREPQARERAPECSRRR